MPIWPLTQDTVKIASHSHDTQAELIEGIAKLSELICRYAIFEQVYLQDQSVLSKSLKDKLTAALKKLYLAHFRYCLEAIQYSERSFAGKALGPAIIKMQC